VVPLNLMNEAEKNLTRQKEDYNVKRKAYQSINATGTEHPLLKCVNKCRVRK
jgi:hypothetical protein